MAVYARVSGTALVPGVSRNGRLYTKDLIRKAVERVRERIAAPDGMPLTMRTHHAADDDSTKLVGRITGMRLADDGSARFEAVLTDTDEARRIASLAEDHGGKPVLKGVSIRGAWVGKPRQVVADDGQQVTTADDLEIDGLDYTATPGVPGAQIERVERVPAGVGAAESSQRTFIFESVQEALVTAAIDEATAPGGSDERPDGPWADPGYQKDGKKRYDIGTKAKAKAAWSYINQADNARLYTAAQLKRVKSKIKAALGRFGVTVAAQEGWLVDPLGQVSETVAEYFGSDQTVRPGSFSINVDNGMVCVTVSSYCIDPHDLDVIARAAMSGACQALAAIDPDADGDIDVPGAPAEDLDGDAGESATLQSTTEAQHGGGIAEVSPPDDGRADPAPATSAATGTESPTDNPNTEEAVVPDATTAPAVETAAPTPQPGPAGVTMSDEQFAALLARLAPPAPVAAPAPVAVAPAVPAQETAPVAPAVTETDDERVARLVEAAVQAQLAKEATPAAPVETEQQRINRLVQERLTEAIQKRVEKDGPPARKGLSTPVNEHSQPRTDGTSAELNTHGLPADWPDKPLHQYTTDEKLKYCSPALMNYVVGDRLPSR